MVTDHIIGAMERRYVASNPEKELRAGGLAPLVRRERPQINQALRTER